MYMFSLLFQWNSHMISKFETESIFCYTRKILCNLTNKVKILWSSDTKTYIFSSYHQWLAEYDDSILCSKALVMCIKICGVNKYTESKSYC
jgi:hypothetical protein